MPFAGESRSRPVRVVLLLTLIAGGILLTRLVEAGRVKPLLLPTATPTRTARSFQEEGEAHFSAGDLDQAIVAYQQAVRQEPDNAELLARLARIQTYSSALMPSKAERDTRLEQARASADRAVELDPDSDLAWAIRGLVYDWNAGAQEGDSPLRVEYFTTAEFSVSRAQLLNLENPLALAYEAEVDVDQLRYAEALDKIQAALTLDPNNLDVQRVYGTVLEGNGDYEGAIGAYEAAAELAPNLTFLYLRIGANYRRLGRVAEALDSFAKAERINLQLGIQDPIPYLAIGRTYLQDGEFFIAARNLEQAVLIDPGNPELLGFLGVIYFKARNYENAQATLACAVSSCDDAQHAVLLCETLQILDCEAETQSLQAAGVIGLDLAAESLEYYYTYGSVLAFRGECDPAGAVFRALEEKYGRDPIVAAIVSEGRSLCNGG
ncbi:MAG: tetratricopeptide repeat protein [Anaerolineales bacterium]